MITIMMNKSTSSTHGVARIGQEDPRQGKQGCKDDKKRDKEYYEP